MAEIESLKGRIERIEYLEEKFREDLGCWSDKQAGCVKFLKQLGTLEQSLVDLKASFDELKLSIAFENIVKLWISREPVETLRDRAARKKARRKNALGLLEAGRTRLDEKLVAKTASLKKPGQLYEKHQRAIKSWRNKRAVVNGDINIPGSLKYINNRIEELRLLPERLKELKESREAITLEIFAQDQYLAATLRNLYGPIQAFINADDLTKTLNVSLDVSIEAQNLDEFLSESINQTKKGVFRRGAGTVLLRDILQKYDFNRAEDVSAFLRELDRLLEEVKVKDIAKRNVQEIYDRIFGLQFLNPTYILKLFDTRIEKLSPGQRGSLLLVFYLLVDKDTRPIIIDQPEGNLDGEYIYQILVRAILRAKKNRQIIIATHNSNLAVCCDSEQIIHAQIDRENNHAVTYETGALEVPTLKLVVLNKLEGTPPAFDNRKTKLSFGLTE